MSVSSAIQCRGAPSLEAPRLVFAIFQTSLLSLLGRGYPGYYNPEKRRKTKPGTIEPTEACFLHGHEGNCVQCTELKLSLHCCWPLPGVLTDTSRNCWDRLPTDRWGGGWGWCLSSLMRAVETISARSRLTPVISAGVPDSLCLPLDGSPS